MGRAQEPLRPMDLIHARIGGPKRPDLNFDMIVARRRPGRPPKSARLMPNIPPRVEDDQEDEIDGVTAVVRRRTLQSDVERSKTIFEEFLS